MLWDMVKLMAKEQEPLREAIYQGIHDYIDGQPRISVRDVYLAGRMDLFLQLMGMMVVHMEVWKNCPEQKTNYERIHSMSIEEMTDFLWKFSEIGEVIPFCKQKSICAELEASRKKIPDYMCKNCLREWLKIKMKKGEKKC